MWEAAEKLAADEAALRAAIKALGKHPESDALTNVLRAIVCLDDELARDRLITLTAKETKESRADIKKGVDRLRTTRGRMENEGGATENEDHAADDEIATAIAELTGRYKWVGESGAFYDMKVRALRPVDVTYNEAYSELPMGDDGKRVPAKHVLLDNPDSKYHLTYRPDGADEFVENEKRYLNTYLPPTLKPLEGDAGLILRHIQYLFGKPLDAIGDAAPYDKKECDHFLDWLAYKAKHPEQKIRHAVIIGSEEGMGKLVMLIIRVLMLKPDGE